MRASTGGLLPNTRSLESTGLFDIKGLRWFYWTRKKPTKRCSLASIIFLGQKEKVSQEMINFFLFFLILTRANSSWRVSKEPPFGHKHLLLLFFCIYYFLISHILWSPHRWKGLDFFPPPDAETENRTHVRRPAPTRDLVKDALTT